jgi:hypothetical protein
MQRGTCIAKHASSSSYNRAGQRRNDILAHVLSLTRVFCSPLAYLPTLPPRIYIWTLSRADEFRKFVSFPAEDFAKLREARPEGGIKGAAASGRKTLAKLFKSASSAVSTAVANVRGGAAAAGAAATSRSAEDEAFADLERSL